MSDETRGHEWRSAFKAFDEAWSLESGHRRASRDGVRETFYEAGYLIGVGVGRCDAENARLRERVAALEATIREALYDYDHRDELGAVVRLRAALAGEGQA